MPAPVPPQRAGESHGTRPLRTQEGNLDLLTEGDIQEGRPWLPWSSVMLKPSSTITESQCNGLSDPPCMTVKSTDFPVPCLVT